MFGPNERSSFAYWFAHWAAYNVVALNMHRWHPKYLLHDTEKPWMLMFANLIHLKEPYKWVQKWHRKHRRHHVENPRVNWTEVKIDLIASKLTKYQTDNSESILPENELEDYCKLYRETYKGILK